MVLDARAVFGCPGRKEIRARKKTKKAQETHVNFLKATPKNSYAHYSIAVSNIAVKSY